MTNLRLFPLSKQEGNIVCKDGLCVDKKHIEVVVMMNISDIKKLTERITILENKNKQNE